jgi:hypothetical protein
VVESYKVFKEINKLIENEVASELSAVQQFSTQFENIEKLRFSYRDKWADEASKDTKHGGSYTLNFAAIHFISESAKAIWVCHALNAIEPQNEISTKGIPAYRDVCQNALTNSQNLIRYNYKMSQTNAAKWVAEIIPFFVSAPAPNPPLKRLFPERFPVHDSERYVNTVPIPIKVPIIFSLLSFLHTY